MGGADSRPVKCSGARRGGGVGGCHGSTYGPCGTGAADDNFEYGDAAEYGYGGDSGYVGGVQFGGSSGSSGTDDSGTGGGWRRWEKGSLQGVRWQRTVQDARQPERGGFKPVRTELVSFNAQYAAAAERMYVISQAYPRAVVGLQSTRRMRDEYGTAYACRKAAHHSVFDFTSAGRTRVKGGQPAGVAILMPTQDVPYVIQILYPHETELQGRAGAVRVRYADGRDVVYVVVYAKVEEQGGEAAVLNRRIWDWVRDILREMPNRCTSVVLTDANGHLGHVREGRGVGTRGLRTGEEADGCVAVGTEGAEVENKNGKVVREFMESERMVAINTVWRGGSGFTYSRRTSTSDGRESQVRTRIDYIILPQECRKDVWDCRVMYKDAVRLQTGTARTINDHVPLRVLMGMWPVGAQMEGGKGRNGKVDVHGMARAAQGVEGEAHRRAELGERVRRGMEERGVEGLLRTDFRKAYETMHEIMYEAEREVFAAQPSKNKYGDFVRDMAEKKLRAREGLVRDEAELLQASREAGSRSVGLGRVHGGLAQIRLRSGEHGTGYDVGRIALWAWRAIMEASVADRAIRKETRRFKRTWTDSLKDDISRAYEERDGAEMWSSARRLAGTQRGPRRRRLNVPAAETPSTGEWAAHLGKAGPEGGCRGRVVREGVSDGTLPENSGYVDGCTMDLETEPPWERERMEECRRRAEGVRRDREARWPGVAHGLAMLSGGKTEAEVREQYMNRPYSIVRRPWHRERGEEGRGTVRKGRQHVRKRFDGTRVLKSFHSLKSRRAVPRGAASRETWVMLLEDVGEFREGMMYAWDGFHTSKAVPRRWQVAEAAPIGKANGKKGCSAVRLINVLDPGGKVFFKELWKDATPPRLDCVRVLQRTA